MVSFVFFFRFHERRTRVGRKETAPFFTISGQIRLHGNKGSIKGQRFRAKRASVFSCAGQGLGQMNEFTILLGPGQETYRFIVIISHKYLGALTFPKNQDR